MTGGLSDYDQGLLDQIGLFADTRLAEQVRAVMVARNNAEAALADAAELNRSNCERANRAEMHADGLRRRAEKAEARLADTQAQLAAARQRIVERQDIIADLLDSVGEERRRAVAAEARLEAVKEMARILDARIGKEVTLRHDDEAWLTELRSIEKDMMCAAALSVAPQPEPAKCEHNDRDPVFDLCDCEVPGPAPRGAS